LLTLQTSADTQVATIFMAVFSIVDDHHRLRSERLQPKAGAGSGLGAWLQAQATKVRGCRAGCTSFRSFS
jgi:hypothetical protein